MFEGLMPKFWGGPILMTQKIISSLIYYCQTISNSTLIGLSFKIKSKKYIFCISKAVACRDMMFKEVQSYFWNTYLKQRGRKYLSKKIFKNQWKIKKWLKIYNQICTLCRMINISFIKKEKKRELEELSYLQYLLVNYQSPFLKSFSIIHSSKLSFSITFRPIRLILSREFFRILGFMNYRLITRGLKFHY